MISILRYLAYAVAGTLLVVAIILHIGGGGGHSRARGTGRRH